MGLTEKKAINDVMENEMIRYQKRVTEHGVTVQLKVDWETLPPAGTQPIELARVILGEATNKLCDMSQNKVSLEEINKQAAAFVVRHDESIQDDYKYVVKLENKQFIFTANLSRFTFSSSNQPDLGKSLEGVL